MQKPIRIRFTILAAIFINVVIIFFMCLAFFGNGFASITWVFVSSLAPNFLVGLTGGVFNFIGGLSAIFVPLVIGYMVEEGNFNYALVFIGAMGIFGAYCYIFLVGKAERIQVKMVLINDGQTTSVV